MRRYSTTSTVLALLLLSMSAIAGESRDPAKIIDTNTCAECHESATEVWRNTKHFNTYGQLHRSKRAREFAEALGISASSIRRPDSECASCHYTVGEARGREKVVAGISCQSCHGAAADWVEIHNEYGGPGVSKETESAVHKSKRYKNMHTAGMVFPADLYGLASNCFQCHLIANEKLINSTDHPTSSAFNLIERSQGNIKHYPAADASKKNKLAIAGISAQTVQGLRALANAKPGSRFASEMESTVRQASSQFNTVAQQLNDKALQKIASLLRDASLSAGNGELIELSTKINELAAAMTGVGGSASKNKATAAQSPAIAKPSVTPEPAPQPEPAQKPKAAPKPITKPATKPAVVAPKPAPKPKPAPRPAPKPAAQPLPQVQSLGEVLISDLALLQPRSTAFCQSLTPWSRGYKKLILSTLGDSCLGIRVSKTAQSNLALFVVTQAGNLQRLLPNNCSFLGVNQQNVARGAEIQLPVNANNQPTAVTLPQPIRTVFAVVASDEKAQHLLDLANTVPDICTAESQDAADFESRLRKLNKASQNHLQWRKAE
ncbi:MAG: outer membrane biosynthesis protein TonB [Bermanella sp.]|jgi:outer membrane biosynthesis protein TonB